MISALLYRAIRSIWWIRLKQRSSLIPMMVSWSAYVAGKNLLVSAAGITISRKRGAFRGQYLVTVVVMPITWKTIETSTTPSAKLTKWPKSGQKKELCQKKRMRFIVVPAGEEAKPLSMPILWAGLILQFTMGAGMNGAAMAGTLLKPVSPIRSGNSAKKR